MLARSLTPLSPCLLNLIMINDSTLCLGLIFGIHDVDPILFITPNNTQTVYINVWNGVIIVILMDALKTALKNS